MAKVPWTFSNLEVPNLVFMNPWGVHHTAFEILHEILDIRVSYAFLSVAITYYHKLGS